MTTPEFENSKHNGVFTLSNSAAFKRETFLVAEFAKKVAEALRNGFASAPQEEWASKGVECYYLAPGGEWQKGRVRISVEFAPDPPPEVVDAESVSDGELILPPGEEE